MARAKALSGPELVDHIPDVLRSIARLVDQQVEGGMPEHPTSESERHALVRLREGFDVVEVMHEFQVLRSCILDACANDLTTITIHEHKVLHSAIDDAIAGSVERYTELRERTLQGFDRVAAAGFESYKLDELLMRLLRALHDTTPSVDMSALFLRSGDALHLRAAVGIDRATEVGQLAISVGEGFVGAVAASARAASLQRPGVMDVKSTVLASANLRVLYAVPLLEHGQVIGVAEVGSLHAERFSDSDIRLIEAMVARASSVIRKQQLRDELDERTRELQALGDNIPQIAFISDGQGRPRWYNRRFYEVTGKTFEDLQREGTDPIHHPAHRERMKTAWRHALATGDSFEELAPLRGRDGFDRWFLIRGVPLRTTEGEIVNWFATATDVNERHVLDEATQILGSSLDYRDTLDKLARFVVPYLADWCIVDLLDGDRLEHVATAATDSEKLALARAFAERYPPHRTDAGAARVLETGKPAMVSEVTPEILAANARDEEQQRFLQQLGFTSWLATPLTARGETLGVLQMMMSESGRRYAEQHIQLARELGQRAGIAVDNARLYRDAQDAIRAREDVLAIVSHDLRNPLGAIGIATTLVSHVVGPDSPGEKHLETIRRSTDRMTRLIDDLLDMASINAGKLSIQASPVDAGELIDEVLDIQQNVAEERGINVERSCEVYGVPLLVDRGRMTQVLHNLVGNALKFCADGDTIFVRSTHDAAHVRFEISDTGPGIATAELPHIFEPYWTGRRKKRGTGLGLFISKAIVEAHAGGISAQSEEGEGATFCVTLPIAKGASS